MVDSGYSRSTPFVQWLPREYSGLTLLAVQKKKKGWVKQSKRVGQDGCNYLF
ncbi:hypothetical protein Hanom_Chr16g01510831 [Helianthus anomalus]